MGGAELATTRGEFVITTYHNDKCVMINPRGVPQQGGGGGVNENLTPDCFSSHDSIGSHHGFAHGVNVLKKGRLQEQSLRTLAYALVCKKY